MTEVEAGEWLAAVAAAREAGHDWFDWLGCVDEIGVSDELRVVLSLRRLADPGAPELLLACRLPRSAAQVASVRSVFAGAAWHEREAAEEFGVEFVGGDPRPLLLAPDAGNPLRKDEVLAARTAGPWPGAKEPGESAGSPSRRRMVPPGVPAPEVWGGRDADTPLPAAADVAASAAGERVRRRSR